MLVAGVGLLAAAGLGVTRQDASAAPGAGGTLRVAYTTDVDSLDPALAFQAWRRKQGRSRPR